MQPNQTGVKPWQWIVTVIVIIVLIVLGFYIFGGKSAAPAPYTSTTTDTTTTANTTANGIVVSDQFPGNIVYISSVQLAQPGFVVITTASNGAPGKVIGSQAFAAGINPGQVNLSESMLDGSSYYAVLYTDSNGNGKYDPATDGPVKDASGSPIMKIFHATSNVQQVKG